MKLDPQRFRPEPTYTGPQVAEAAGLDLEWCRHLLRALGLPDVSDDAVEFDDRDLSVLKTIRMLLDGGYSERDIVTVARTYGQSISRIGFAEARLFRQTVVDPMVDEGLSPPEIHERVGEVVPGLLDVLDTLLSTVHRRHLAVALQQVTGTNAAGPTEILAAGFVDLVGFSRLSNDVEADDLEELVSSFESMAIERSVAAGAQVVKVLGDAVMFVATSADAAVDAALHIVRGADDDTDLPPARAGLDHGRVRPLGGDYFGRPINVAARLTNFARPGTVVGSNELLNSLQRERDASRIGHVRLKGVGPVLSFKIKA